MGDIVSGSNPQLFRYWMLKKRYYLIQTNLSAYVLSV